MVMHRRDEGDRSISELMPVSPGDKLTSNSFEKDELGNVVEMAKAAKFGRSCRNRHMFGKNCRPYRKLDGFTDWAKSH